VNRVVRERVHTPHLYARLEHIVERADGFVVLPGSLGTLSELFLAWTLVSVNGHAPAPVVLLGEHWERFLDALRDPDLVRPELFEYVEFTRDPSDAARRVLAPARAVAGKRP
jgi:predicted Rossmann-fold nucleotide-binding protein